MQSRATSLSKPPHLGKRILKVILWFFGVQIVIGAIGFIAFQVSPWPAALTIRWLFDKGSAATAARLEKFLPSNVTSIVNVRYGDGEDELLDVHFPSEIVNTGKTLQTVVWVHGGGWLSGSKNDVANYLKILAGKGFTVVGVGYSIAPAATYPTPLRQVNAALGYLVRNAATLHVDPRFVLAGDSAGAQIAAQLANMISAPSYANDVGIAPWIDRAHLAGMILYCGPYDLGNIKPQGFIGFFVRAMPWAYSGKKDFIEDKLFGKMSVAQFVTANFPPSFISAGNADPLEPQSHTLVENLSKFGVRVDTLFFPDDHRPALPHEYQFNLDTDEGQLALERSIEFLRSLK